MKRALGLVIAALMLTGTTAFAGKMEDEEFNDPDGAIGVLTSGTEDQRENAAEYLGEIKHAPATQHLLKALNDPSDDVREEAARALGKIKAKEAVDALIGKLDEDSSGVRAAAAEALARIGDPKAIEPIKRQLASEKNPINQIRIRNALEQLQATAPVK